MKISEIISIYDRDLNWAGLSITTELTDLTYHVNFEESE